MPISDIRVGATPEDWINLQAAGLTEYLLPVVCDLSIPISPKSTLKALGKTPSIVRNGMASGIPAWTSHRSTFAQVEAWSRNDAYGACVQTVVIAAIDADIDDGETAERVHDIITAHLGEMPMRYRDNASKFLVAFELPDDDLGKRIIRLAKGIIEFLARGQQFVAAGRHTSGSRYAWTTADGTVPPDFPVVSRDKFERLWAALELEFGTESEGGKRSKSRHERHSEAVANDPVAIEMLRRNMVRSGPDRDGKLHITCPFEELHTSGDTESATTYFPRNTGGYARGHFKCLHAHCAGRKDHEFMSRLGIGIDDYDEVPEDDELEATPASPVPVAVSAAPAPVVVSDELVEITIDDYGPAQPAAVEPEKPRKKRKRFTPESLVDFLGRPPMRWIIKGIVPDADLTVIYGEPGAGKSFVALDLALCMATGTPWRGKRTKKKRVVYVCAEGLGGVSQRIQAGLSARKLEMVDVDLAVVPDAPSLVEDGEVSLFIERLREFGTFDVLIADTLAQMMPGADENSSEGMGLAMKALRRLQRELKVRCIVVHHAGKDASKGARGWSGLTGAADAMVFVGRDKERDERWIEIGKQKDAADGEALHFKLVVHELGLDEDGDPLTSCSVEACDPPVVGVTPSGQSVRSQFGRLILAVFDELAGVEGRAKRDSVVRVAIDRLPHDPSAGKDRRANRVVDGLSRLVGAGNLHVDGEFLTRTLPDR